MPTMLALADDSAWLPEGTDDYAVDGNWEFNVVPELTATFQDVALINNGGTAVLSTATNNNAGITLVDGTLQIDRGGALATGTDFGATGELNQQAGGVLQMGGLTGTNAATLNIASSAMLAGETRLIGPNANLSAATLVLSGTLNTVVTPNGISAIDVAGDADIGGELVLDFSGVAPMTGDTWTLVDAGNLSGSGFVSVSTTSSLGPGQLLQISQTAGGNGTLLQASVEQGLMLTANRRTGEIQLVNPSSTDAIDIDGYLVSSADGNLLPTGWTSLSQQGHPGMTESNAANTHFGELNLEGSNSIATNSRVSLGYALDPSIFSEQQSTDLRFEYHIPGGGTVSTPVAYVGPTRDIALLIDSQGQSFLQNQTSEDIVIDGYFISSSSASIEGAGWSTIADIDANWTSSPATSSHLGELRLEGGTTLLAEGEAINLGTIFDATGVRDLVFEYHVFGGGTERGSVVYDAEPHTFVTGDYTFDGIVDASDYQLWKSTFGSNSQLSADGNGNGVVDLADYVIWRNHLGTSAMGTSAVSSQAVPEPLSAVMLLSCCVAGTLFVRRTRANH
ncbi:hypothetical protein NG895_12250 [Aeoliella sp. ICT_H6.2]|uniref:Dockerin domain-containing protein n=1 Tax=Aeoliella straminimaris TaxID=2954799 RepID=A0A9X2JG39_9BACT|nr:hypothetical protein [Aeoliella straminimaris]MCO6044680.1 hypothetical protein [Aeoliella straminimaris]